MEQKHKIVKDSIPRANRIVDILLMKETTFCCDLSSRFSSGVKGFMRISV